MSVQTEREVAHRVFATEYNAAGHEVSDSDDERAPNYVIMPTGARVNRLFVVGVLTSVESVSEQTVRARIADPTGTFVVYAGQYQPDERATLEQIEPPAFVAVTGKANTFTPEGSDDVLTSVRPEAVSEVDGDTRDRWVLTTAEHTRDRIRRMARALQAKTAGRALGSVLEDDHRRGIEQALEAYDTTGGYLAALDDCVTETIAVIAGEQSEAGPIEIAPNETVTERPDLAALTGEPGPTTDPTASDRPAPTDTDGEPTEPAESHDDQPTTSTPKTEPDDEVAVEEPSASSSGSDEQPADFEPDVDEPLYEFDEEERAAIKSEHGLEFETGNEVPEPDEEETADATDEQSELPATDPAEPTDAEPTDPEPADAEPTDPETADGESPAEDTDMVGAVLGALEAHSDGDGVKRTTVIETVVENTGASETAVKEAIEEALLSGRCYEPTEDRLKPI